MVYIYWYILIGIEKFHDIFSSVVVNGEERFLRLHDVEVILKCITRKNTSDTFQYVESVDNMNGSYYQ